MQMLICHSLSIFVMMMMMMMMMMMNCFCGMVYRRKAFSLICSREHCERPSPSRISNTPRAGFEPAQNLKSGLVESKILESLAGCLTELCASDFC